MLVYQRVWMLKFLKCGLISADLLWFVHVYAIVSPEKDLGQIFASFFL